MPDQKKQATATPFSKLPDLLMQVLLHEENTDINIAIEKENTLSRQQGTAMMAIIRKVILRTIRPNDLLSSIQNDLKLDIVPSKKLALDLLGRRFLPMQWYIGNVEGLIKELGGDVAKYEAEARKNYPEVYAPKTETADPTSIAKEQIATEEKDEPTILHDIADKLTTPKGRAEVLLRLTALSQQIEEAGKTGKLSATESGALMHSLDALSYAVNTQDLNPLEIAAIKRRLKNILGKVGE